MFVEFRSILSEGVNVGSFYDGIWVIVTDVILSKNVLGQKDYISVVIGHSSTFICPFSRFQ